MAVVGSRGVERTLLGDAAYDVLPAYTSEPVETRMRSNKPFEANCHAHSPEEGMIRIGYVGGGILDDVRRRLPYYIDDYKQCWNRKTLSSSIFLFFTTFASTVALGVVINRNTACPKNSRDNCDPESSYIGVAEMLLMNSVAGMIHAVAGCQPLLILRPTGPITAFLSLLFNTSRSLKLDFLQFLVWTGRWRPGCVKENDECGWK
ncbi:hypothetical protein CYMTET_55498 [Cymbomonas tetramitiformis]|uniref:Bicarbonate transporter-like transmembrane domain-containing protein n=1 Tax=Cymbomonas tetramitiformis TaxID=36881 RepID=A0AAE0BD88_9CHLO|nr:hypothetical protein CYMTET_55498 [Cymbomonas tetramitiformis]